MNISYVTVYDSQNIHSWSGSGYYIAQALENQQNKIDYIGGLSAKPNAVVKLKSKFYGGILKKKFDISREEFIARKFAQQVKRLIKSDSNVVFSPGTTPIAYLDTRLPKVFYTDATFAGMIDFYDSYANLSKETIKHGNMLEQQAFDSSKLAIFSSDWAAQTAIDNYKVDPRIVKVVPFGANIECNRDQSTINNIVAKRSKTECHLLFIGVDWNRKGGNLTLKVADKLNRMGLKTTLHVVGTIPESVSATFPAFVVNHGFISKSNEVGKNKLDELLSMSHFLIVPSIAEAYGLVFCEASSFGLPSISRNVGGIPTIVKDDINGKLFELSENEDAYASYLHTLFFDNARYVELCASSFNEYTTRLNWTVSGKVLNSLMREII